MGASQKGITRKWETVTWKSMPSLTGSSPLQSWQLPIWNTRKKCRNNPVNETDRGVWWLEWHRHESIIRGASSNCQIGKTVVLLTFHEHHIFDRTVTRVRKYTVNGKIWLDDGWERSFLFMHSCTWNDDIIIGLSEWTIHDMSVVLVAICRR